MLKWLIFSRHPAKSFNDDFWIRCKKIFAVFSPIDLFSPHFINSFHNHSLLLHLVANPSSFHSVKQRYLYHREQRYISLKFEAIVTVKKRYISLKIEAIVTVKQRCISLNIEALSPWSKGVLISRLKSLSPWAERVLIWRLKKKLWASL